MDPSPPATNTQNTVITPHGVFVLRSGDGIDFTVDATILPRALELFRHLLVVSGTLKKPLEMEESAKTIDTMLRLFYPADSPPPLLDVQQAVDFMRMMEKFFIKSYLTDQFIDICLARCHPLRAWAVAVRFGRADNQKSSAKLYFMMNLEENVSGFPELGYISAERLASLQEVHVFARAKARHVFARMPWTCPVHAYGLWHSQRMGLIYENPFDNSKYSEDALGILIATVNCHGCFDHFRQTVNDRHQVREWVYQILQDAITLVS
ncbi:hypothetical protein DL93DRAFT_766237 [Clavulina sp. PMI_390]|nr:hypothetical protein DL93DRAFT_766237 [Clavulina sp. PMI_390]